VRVSGNFVGYAAVFGVRVDGFVLRETSLATKHASLATKLAGLAMKRAGLATKDAGLARKSRGSCEEVTRVLRGYRLLIPSTLEGISGTVARIIARPATLALKLRCLPLIAASLAV